MRLEAQAPVRAGVLPAAGQRPPAPGPQPLDPAAWAQVHDGGRPRDLVFRRGIELCLALCADRIRPGERWADLGSGTGNLGRLLAARGARVVGIDRDLAMAAYARRHGSPGLPHQVVADVTALPLAAGSCAGAVAVSLLGCLPGTSGVAALLAAAARVVADGGTLCLTAMNRRSLLLAVTRGLGWRRRGEGRYTAHDPAVLAALLRQAGFTPERQILYGHFLAAGPLLLPGAAASRRLERAVPPGGGSLWARQVIILARRRLAGAAKAG